MKLLSTIEAAQKLGVSERRVRQLINEGKLEAHKLGRDYAVEETALELVRIHGKAGRPRRWKGHTIFVEGYENTPNLYKVEFVSGLQQPYKDGKPQRVPPFPFVEVDFNSVSPTFYWKIEPKGNNFSIEEFETQAIAEIEDFINNNQK